MTIVAERTKGPEGLHIGLVGEGRQFIVAFDAYRTARGRVVYKCGIGEINGRSFDANETTQNRQEFVSGIPRRIRCSVRKSGVSVFVEGKRVLQWRGKFARLGLGGYFTPPAPRGFYVGSANSAFRITTLLVTPLSGPGKRIQ